jgi:hypothetical protein
MRIKKFIAACVGILWASGALAVLPKAISFDGYCDGISHIKTSPAGVVTGVWDLSLCPTDLGRHPAALLRGSFLGEKGQTGTYNTLSNPDLLPPSVIRIDDSGRFVYYDTEGQWMTSGTWSPIEQAKRGTGLSTRR